jgi:hypothetical protein
MNEPLDVLALNAIQSCEPALDRWDLRETDDQEAESDKRKKEDERSHSGTG